MWIMRAAPGGKRPKIVCSGCGKRAAYAGDAVLESDIAMREEPDGLVQVIEKDDLHPVCEACLTILEQASEPPIPARATTVRAGS